MAVTDTDRIIVRLDLDPADFEELRETVLLRIGDRETDETREERDARADRLVAVLTQLDSPANRIIPLSEELCHICGTELDPSQPFDGHRECREQE